MLLDFNDASANDAAREFDVAIVGAGIAGSILACELARRGKRVVVLESGGLRQPGETHPLNRVVHAAAEYRGAEHGRFRCLGGTSTRWGGALIPFRREDLEAPSPLLPTGWPIRLDELTGYLPGAERLFDLPTSPYEQALLEADLRAGAAADFDIRAAKWPAFRRRNVAHLLAAPLRARAGPSVWLNATLTALQADSSGRIVRLQVRGTHGTSELCATEIVLAAGAIESTRLLLKLDADLDGRIAGKHDLLGRHFHDHLSAPVARIAAPQRHALNRYSGFQFEQSGMRNIRFELKGGRHRAAGLPGAFLHVACTTRTRSGFDALRDVYRAVQRGRAPARADLGLLARHAGWLSRAGWSRIMERRVLPPDDAEYEIHLVTEQVPVASNRITLSRRERDAFGVPLARIEWRVSEDDLSNSERVLDVFSNYWEAGPRAVLGELELYPRERRRRAFSAGGGIFHPGGSLRMAASPATGVVDRDLRVFGISNLRVLSTAAFPTGGSANPTLMLILFALRAADQLGGARS